MKHSYLVSWRFSPDTGEIQTETVIEIRHLPARNQNQLINWLSLRFRFQPDLNLALFHVEDQFTVDEFAKIVENLPKERVIEAKVKLQDITRIHTGVNSLEFVLED